MPKACPIEIDAESLGVPLTRGQVAIIDRADWSLVSLFAWYAKPRSDGQGFYAVSRQAGQMHRLILDAKPGQVPDHRDGDGLNNRRANLRIGDQARNMQNRRPISRALPQGVMAQGGRFYARFKANGKLEHLGGFATPEEAHEAYLARKLAHNGEWVHSSLRK